MVRALRPTAPMQRHRLFRVLAVCASLGASCSPGNTMELDSGGSDARGPAQDATFLAPDAPPRPDAGPPIVHDCSSLPSAGTWESLTIPTPPGFVLPDDEMGVIIAGVEVDPHAPGVIYMGLALYPRIVGLGLWRSEDCGASWGQVATGALADEINSGTQYTILFDPRDPDVIVSQSFYGTGHLYRSANRGVDWTDITPTGTGVPGFVQVASMDPHDPDHLLLTFHADCQAPHAAFCLAESRDQGASWRIIDGPAALRAWSEAAGPMIIDERTWLVTVPSSGDGGVFYTNDAGQSWDRVIGYPGCAPGLIRPGDAEPLYLACLDNLGLQRSADGHTWTHVEGSPAANGFIRTEDTWFASFNGDRSGHPIFSAPTSNETQWTRIETPTMVGGTRFAYDGTHRVLFANADPGELWRVVLE